MHCDRALWLLATSCRGYVVAGGCAANAADRTEQYIYMKISVITVCFNSESTIADTMRSVAEQTHLDIEHIVIDGASTDATLTIVRELGSQSVQIISERDDGIYHAMNKGVDLATGDFVGFLNADDTFASPMTVALIARAASEAGADAVYGDLSYVHKARPTAVLRYWSSGPFKETQLAHGWMPPHPTFYVRRALLDQLGRFDLNFRISADYDFMLRCLTRPGIVVVYLPTILVFMRTGGASNNSLSALIRKSSEDLAALRKNGVGGVRSLTLKNARKLSQFFRRPT